MKRGLILAFLAMGFVVLLGPWTVASADGNRSDFALFDGTNPVNKPFAGALCGAKKGKAYTYHVTVTNHGGAGFVRIKYADKDFVEYQIPAGGSFSFSQAAGSGDADRAVRVSNGGSGAVLVGSMSVLGEEGGKPFCKSCDDADGIPIPGPGTDNCGAIPIPYP